MKVVFLQNVSRVGKAGEVKEVADGYAKNYLLPKRLALPATPAALKTVEAQIEREGKVLQRSAEELESIAQQIEGMVFTFRAKVMEGGRIYGSVRDIQIAEEIERCSGADIERTKIELDQPIRELGTYELVVRLSRDLAPKIRVVVTGEE